MIDHLYLGTGVNRVRETLGNAIDTFYSQGAHGKLIDGSTYKIINVSNPSWIESIRGLRIKTWRAMNSAEQYLTREHIQMLDMLKR